MKIGDMVWIHVERVGWREEPITGENRISWIAGPHWGPIKINKKNLANGGLRSAKATRQEVDDAEWVQANRWHIGTATSRVEDALTLRTIADMIGYKPAAAPEEGK